MKLTARFALSAEWYRKLTRDLCPSQHGRVCAAGAHLPLDGARLQLIVHFHALTDR